MQTAYVVKFESEQDANSFYDQFRAAPSLWRDPRAGSMHQIRVGRDLPIEVRRRSYAMNKC
eukprot:4971969-Pyramimonas_sp.AAC.1